MITGKIRQLTGGFREDKKKLFSFDPDKPIATSQKDINQEHARWVAAVNQLIENIDFHKPGMSPYEAGFCYGGKAILEELLSIMEVSK